MSTVIEVIGWRAQIALMSVNFPETAYGYLPYICGMSASNTARVDLRLDPAVKTLIANAAKAAGFKSMSDFIIQAALDKVDAMTSRMEIIKLPKEAQEQILEMLANPRPNERARAMLERSDKLFLDDDTVQISAVRQTV